MSNRLVSMLGPYVRPYRRRIAAAMLATAAFNGLSLMPPLLFRYLIDHVVQAGNWDRLIVALAAYAAAPVLAQALNFANTQGIVYVASRIVADLRAAMYRLLLRLSARYHAEHATGGMLTRLMGDVGVVQQLVSGQTVQIVGDLMVFGFSIVVAFTIHWDLALILIAVSALYAGAYRVFSRRIQAATHSMQTVNDLLVARLQETLEGVRHVRIYNREIQERETYLARTAEGMQHGFRSGTGSVALSATCSLVAGYGSTVIYAMAGYYVLHGTMTLGDLIALNSYVWMALHPALRLTAFAGQFAQIRVSLDRIAEVMRQEPEVRSAPGAPDIQCSEGRVEFRRVAFSYEPDKPLFHDLNLVVQGGTSVALVGHTGCGKTTLTSLLMRLWDVQDGALLIDGVDIRRVSLPSLRRLFGVVLQAPVLFEGTVAENIAYGDPLARRPDIESAAEAAEVFQFAQALPDGLDTVLGTYGVKLSVGQKQRISIARAILKNPRLLIMDEATSAIDSEAEAAIQRAIGRLLRGRTSFVVAHRLSTIVRSDLIIVLDHGRVVEQGTHDALMSVDRGAYRRLYEEMQRTGRGETR